MKDFYDRELVAGDKVLYGGGYSVVREGIIEKITDDYISIRPYRDAYGEKIRTKYYHEVTGKWIDPYYHLNQQSGYYHKETGERITAKQGNQYIYEGYPVYAHRVLNPEYVPFTMQEWRGSEFKDYVKEIKLKGGYVSVLYNPKGIVKLPLEEN